RRYPMRGQSRKNTGSICRPPSRAQSPIPATNSRSGVMLFCPPPPPASWPARPMRWQPPVRARARPVTTASCSATACRGRRARSPRNTPGWPAATRRGDAREAPAHPAGRARAPAAAGRRMAILSGGELTVTLKGGGRGGPNQEYALALALAIHLAGAKGIAAMAADTDGTDGGQGRPDDPAGAFIDDTTLIRAKGLGLDPAAFLADNDSTGFFNAIGDLFVPGPPYPNVTDFRAILVDRPAD